MWPFLLTPTFLLLEQTIIVGAYCLSYKDIISLSRMGYTILEYCYKIFTFGFQIHNFAQHSTIQ